MIEVRFNRVDIACERPRDVPWSLGWFVSGTDLPVTSSADVLTTPPQNATGGRSGEVAFCAKPKTPIVVKASGGGADAIYEGATPPGSAGPVPPPGVR